MGTVERREREKQQRSEAIMEAALEVFAEKGLTNATMNDVAEKAELSKGSIYNYFKSKEHLFFAIDMRAGKMLKQRFAEADRSEKTGIRKVLAIGHAYYDFCFDYPNYFRAMAYIGRLDSKVYMEVAKEMMPGGLQSYKDRPLAVLADAIRVGQADGSIAKDIDPMEMSIFLWSASNGIIHMIKYRGELMEQAGLPVKNLFGLYGFLLERGLAPLRPNGKN